MSSRHHHTRLPSTFGLLAQHRKFIMKSHLLIHPIVLVILTCGAFAAEKQKSASVSDYPFWTAPKKGASVAQFVPGLTAVLELTEAQKQQIAAAREEMVNDEGVKAARSLPKVDPNVTEAQRDKARADVEAATAKMQEKVNAILSVEQKAMIANINGAYAEASKQVGATYSEKFGAVKVGPEERMRMQQAQREEVETLFRRMLGEMLSPAQKEAMAAAAALEEKKSTKPDKKPALK